MQFRIRRQTTGTVLSADEGKGLGRRRTSRIRRTASEREQRQELRR